MTDHSEEPTSPWVTEHFGFEPIPAETVTRTPTAAAGSPAHPTLPRGGGPGLTRVRLLTGTGALALCLVAGTGGYAVAATADGPDTGGPAAHVAHVAHVERGGRPGVDVRR